MIRSPSDACLVIVHEPNAQARIAECPSLVDAIIRHLDEEHRLLNSGWSLSNVRRQPSVLDTNTAGVPAGSPQHRSDSFRSSASR